ncbi:MAG: IPExxxVDY family protein [Salinivirgaceae bacterium]|nr:IPExxxVDY family protein [Salinivirgaceae bacterium]
MQNKVNTCEPEPIAALAIVSCEPLYRLAWLVNQQFGWALAESEPVTVMNKDHALIQQFFAFVWCDTENSVTYRLIQNKGAQGPLEPTMKTIDYWLRIDNVSDVSNILAELKKINGIQMVQEIKPADLKKTSPVFRNPLQ